MVQLLLDKERGDDNTTRDGEKGVESLSQLLIELLIEKGANVNAKTRIKEWTALST